MWFILALTSLVDSLSANAQIAVVPFRHILPRTLVLAIPSGLSTSKGACEAVASRREIEDGVDSRATRANSNHDRALV